MSIHPVSNTLQLNRFSYGVKLCKARKDKRLISTILKLPMAIYFEDCDGVIQKANAMNAELCCGFDSPEEAIGKKYFSYIKKRDAIKLRKNDALVVKNNQALIVEVHSLEDLEKIGLGIVNDLCFFHNFKDLHKF